MKKIRQLSTAGTIICFISVIIYIVVALFILFSGVSDSMSEFVSGSMGKIDSIDSNSPSAGYELLAYLFGGMLGMLGIVFTFLFLFFLGFLVLYQIPAIVSGLVAGLSNKKNNNIIKSLRLYKIDGFIKAIMNGIVVGGVWLMMLSDFGHTKAADVFIMLVVAWNYIAVLILSIFQINNIKIEERRLKIK